MAARIQAVGTLAPSAGSAAPAWPTHLTDDIGVLLCEAAGGEAVAAPATWTEFPNSPQATGAGTAGTRICAFWKRAASAGEGAPTVADPGDHVNAVIITVRGCPASGIPYDVTGGGVKAGASTSVSATGVTTTAKSECILIAIARDNDLAAAAFSAWANAGLSGLIERFDSGTALGLGGGIGVASARRMAIGATGTTTATVTSSINAFLTIAFLNGPTAGERDHFDGRSASSGWGAGVEATWTERYPGGPSTQFSVASGKALIIQSTLGNTFLIGPDRADSDADVLFRIKTDKVAAGQRQELQVSSRWTSISSYYNFSVRFNTNQSVSSELFRIQGGTQTSRVTDTVISGLTHGASTEFMVRAQIEGPAATPVLRLKVWLATNVEPVAWAVDFLDAGDGTITGTLNAVGEYMETGTSNTPVTWSFDDWSGGEIAYNDDYGVVTRRNPFLPLLSH